MVNLIFKRLCIVVVYCFMVSFSFGQQFKFAFLTDSHIQSESTLKKVDSLIKSIPNDVSFMVTGGDNVDIDYLTPENLEGGKRRYGAFKAILDGWKKPYYVTVGNHDRLPKSLRNGQNDFEVFQENFGATYYSFDHQGYRFVVLNSVFTDEKGGYIIPKEQEAWLVDLLKKTPHSQPLIVVTHVPFLSVYYPVLEGRYTAADTFVNQKQVFDLFEKHNLKLVLQGHMHLYEEIKVKNVPFITAGAVSGNWWGGAFHGTQPGYLLVDINKDEVTWTYK